MGRCQRSSERSGVYCLKQGSRVFEAVQEAGGFLENADTTGINQASVLSDGEKLQIYTIEEVQQMEVQPEMFSGSSENTESGGKININTADLTELQEIPGVGEKRHSPLWSIGKPAEVFRILNSFRRYRGLKGKHLIKSRIT